MEYNGNLVDIEGNDLIINQITNDRTIINCKLFLFKLKTKSDKLRYYEIKNSIASKDFIKAYIADDSNALLLSDDLFYLYDSENNKKNCLINLNDCEPRDFIYYKKNLIFIQKDKFSLFQAKADGKCNILLNLIDAPLKVNFCSCNKDMLYLCTSARIYFLKLIYSKDKILKVKNTQMSLPFKFKQEEYAYHSFENKFYKIKNEYKEVIHVCSYSDKEVTVYKFVKGEFKNKKKCFVKLSVNKLNNEIIKGCFFFKIKRVSKGQEKKKKDTDVVNNNYNEVVVKGSNDSNLEDEVTEGKKKCDSEEILKYENVNCVDNLPCDENNLLQNNDSIFSNEKIVRDENSKFEEEHTCSDVVTTHNGKNNNIENEEEEKIEEDISTNKEEDIIKLYLLIYSENGRILIYFVDYLNLADFKFGFVGFSNNPIAFMHLPFKAIYIYNISELYEKRVIKQKKIIQKKKKLSSNYCKYMEHIINKEIYINSNLFIDTVLMNEGTVSIYTIQIHNNLLLECENNMEPTVINVVNCSNKVVAVKKAINNENKNDEIKKIINESKYSCYSDSDSYIDSDITWTNSDKSDDDDDNDNSLYNVNIDSHVGEDNLNNYEHSGKMEKTKNIGSSSSISNALSQNKQSLLSEIDHYDNIKKEQDNFTHNIADKDNSNDNINNVGNNNDSNNIENNNNENNNIESNNNENVNNESNNNENINNVGNNNYSNHNENVNNESNNNEN
ncbi:conserved Plasmodium protein, unknown function, partial [Plasmodium malariae]